ncbi:protease prsW family-domain-containing protein [Daldinia caldariorum]|uniref:protease prsW family-domain-containing protein n=1 Tax=Daldinia caldariorum TaxID=326644 RepID=UPI002008A256|nr:protease prsW family-domain-containing protein [Daldinia caldariorum]KAI1467587.1 protease prsW family-domain-containing protein [Daldinia caldariorum]
MEEKHKAVDVSNTSQFSRSTRILLWVILPAIFIALGIASPLTALLSLFVLAPTFCLLWYDRARPVDQRTDPETFIWTYVLVGTVGVFAVVVAQSLLLYLLSYTLFPSSVSALLAEFARDENKVASLDAEALAARRQIAGCWQYWALMFLFAYCGASIPEELLKYSGLVYARRRGRITHEHNYVALAAAAALGFSTFENIGFMYAAVGVNQDFAHLALAIVERVLIGSPMHVMSGLLIGLAAAGRDFRGETSSLAQIIGLPAVIHGAWDFSLFGISALNGNVGWIHPHGKSLLATIAVAVIVEGTLLFVVRRRFASWNSREAKTK